MPNNGDLLNVNLYRTLLWQAQECLMAPIKLQWTRWWKQKLKWKNYCNRKIIEQSKNIYCEAEVVGLFWGLRKHAIIAMTWINLSQYTPWIMNLACLYNRILIFLSSLPLLEEWSEYFHLIRTSQNFKVITKLNYASQTKVISSSGRWFQGYRRIRSKFG